MKTIIIMLRSMLILFLLTRCHGFENESKMILDADNGIMYESFEESSSSISSDSVEDMTTISYLMNTNVKHSPPMPTVTAQKLILVDELHHSHEMNMKLIATSEQSIIEVLAEPSSVMAITPEPLEEDQMVIEANIELNRSRESKKIEENLETPESRSQDALESSVEDTTTVQELESDNETNIDLGEDLTTIQPPFSKSKESKQIKIYKTSPNELLRMYVEDCHLRSPVAALVDKKSNPLFKAKKLWKAALKPNSLLDIMVVSYDSEGIKSTYNLTNTKTMMETLDKVREENITDQESKTYYSIIRTGQLIPYDSAIFLSTDSLPNDTEHQQPASMILLKKRIRLYLVIFDEKNVSISEKASTAVRQTGFLGKLALRTGGDIIYVPNHAFKADGELGKITLVVADKIKTLELAPLEEVGVNELKSTVNTDDMDVTELSNATSLR